MKMLIYGFEPHVGQKEDISKEILKRIKDKPDLIKVTIPVRFDKEIIINEIKKHQPDVIIGIGQCKRGGMIRIERKAFNKIEYVGVDNALPVLNERPDHLFLSLKIKKDEETWLSYDPGRHISNFSMYLISHHFKSTKFAFFRVPHDYDAGKAVYYMEYIISEIRSKVRINSSQKRLTKFV